MWLVGMSWSEDEGLVLGGPDGVEASERIELPPPRVSPQHHRSFSSPPPQPACSASMSSPGAAWDVRDGMSKPVESSPSRALSPGRCAAVSGEFTPYGTGRAPGHSSSHSPAVQGRQARRRSAAALRAKAPPHGHEYP
eukprot:768707-Hanusia_phi.AAC.6